jgi:hypothetical protein
MERLHYSGDVLVTGTDIALAVIDYAEALAKSASSASIQIPVRRSDGSAGVAQILIGPASQLAAEQEPDSGPELVDPQLVGELRRQIAQLAEPRARSEQTFADADDFELTEMIEQVCEQTDRPL